MSNERYNSIISKVKGCEECTPHLPLGPRPVFQIHPEAKILVAGQAPGRKVHETGIPFDDLSGDRLCEWMGIQKTTFYDETQIAILPMGFCYPGTGKSGDLAPRKECASLWRPELLSLAPNIKLTLVIGQYAMDWHLGASRKKNLTETVKAWPEYWPNYMPLPHPSPRNNIWLSKNNWFEANVLPALKKRVRSIVI